MSDIDFAIEMTKAFYPFVVIFVIAFLLVFAMPAYLISEEREYKWAMEYLNDGKGTYS